MAFPLLDTFLTTGFSGEVATNSAIGMIGSFLAAGALIVVPAAFALIWVSQNDALTRGR
ncbi:photosystem II reaction center X protein [Prochlorococcus sp. MIT 1223]|uniref:photosystem II reaction center X protein n=1 Tax=Prochlorococcus sp. MIT 1223 TaxID=3096217 RepID=UPI002A750828|nr:photosystem II reaction center X protein [Prochlorococcus sp. MIT 1223]